MCKISGQILQPEKFLAVCVYVWEQGNDETQKARGVKFGISWLGSLNCLYWVGVQLCSIFKSIVKVGVGVDNIFWFIYEYPNKKVFDSETGVCDFWKTRVAVGVILRNGNGVRVTVGNISNAGIRVVQMFNTTGQFQVGVGHFYPQTDSAVLIWLKIQLSLLKWKWNTKAMKGIRIC